MLALLADVGGSFISGASGLVGAAIGGFITWKVTKRQVDAAISTTEKRITFDREEAKADRQHQLDLAREERAYRDLSRAYEEMLVQIGRGARNVKVRRPPFGYEQAPVVLV